MRGVFGRMINWDLAVRIFYVHFFPPAERNEPKKRRLGKGGFINQNAASRILIYINISPRPRPHPSVGKADERGRFFIINGFNCTRNTVAVILRLKFSRFYEIIRLHHQIICGEVFWLHLFSQKRWNAFPASPTNQNLINSFFFFLNS